MRSAPDNITELAPYEVFVFGSNANGKHAGGAARYALDHFGAVYGQGEGLQGSSYAIPTMEGLENIRQAADRFIQYTERHPELTFLMTRVACGIAGYSEDDIAPIFKHTPANVRKPRGWA